MKPERVGMSPARMSRIRSAVERHIGEDKLAGAVTLLARRGSLVHFESVGLMDRERGRPMRLDAIFRIYSMTKPITSVALMILYEQGRLQLYDPVAAYLPSFGNVTVWNGMSGSDSGFVPLARPITVRDLLTHTSGLTYWFWEYGLVEQAYRDAGVGSRKPLAEMVSDVARMPLAFQPGTHWRYSVSHDVIARIVEVISGEPYGDFLRANIFDPLGMRDTGFQVPPENLERLTAMYGTRDFEEPGITLSALSENAASCAKHLLADPYDDYRSKPPAIHRGGHGLFSTAMDYYAFCRMLLDGGTFRGSRILGRKSIELMTTNQLSSELLRDKGPGYGYGFGVQVLLDLGQCQTLGSVGEYDWVGGANTDFWIDPREQMIGILLSQFFPGLHRIGQDFRVCAYQAIDD